MTQIGTKATDYDGSTKSKEKLSHKGKKRVIAQHPGTVLKAINKEHAVQLIESLR